MEDVDALKAEIEALKAKVAELENALKVKDATFQKIIASVYQSLTEPKPTVE